MANLLELSCRDEQDRIRVVVESPRGSKVKLKYDPSQGAFELQRFIGDAGYPYDWGFIPGTRAADGDPLDALVIHEASTWPGVIIPSIAVALLKISEVPDGAHESRRNDRLIAVPAAHPSVRSVDERSTQTRTELERFFVATGELAKKRVRVNGWGDASEAKAALDAACAELSKRA